MGVDYSSFAGIGLRIDRSKLFVKRNVRAFDHDFPEEMLFHPQTGKKLWGIIEDPIHEYDERMESIAGYSVKCGTCNEDDSGQCKVYILINPADTRSHKSGGDHFDAKTAIPIPDQIEEFISTMKRLGLWDEGEIGLWVVSNVSY